MGSEVGFNHSVKKSVLRCENNKATRICMELDWIRRAQENTENATLKGNLFETVHIKIEDVDCQ